MRKYVYTGLAGGRPLVFTEPSDGAAEAAARRFDVKIQADAAAAGEPVPPPVRVRRKGK